jgi:soluble lytic murein transglycosylase
LLLALLSAFATLLLGAREARGATPLPRPVSQPLPSMAGASAAERNGDYAGAESAYRMLAASTDPTIAAAGQLALGRLLERTSRSADAIAPLQAAAAALGRSPDGLRATFMLGEAQFDQGQHDQAAASFQLYLTANGPAAGYAALELAWSVQAGGDHAGALAALAAPLQATSPTIRRAALLAASLSHERLGDPGQAAADEEALVDSRPPAADRATALLQAGRLYHLAGDDADAVAALQQLVQAYPGYTAAASALDRLDGLGAGVDPLQRAIVLLDNGSSDDARTILRQYLADNPNDHPAAAANYYLGLIADRKDENERALADYADAYALEPGGPLAALALWRHAELLRILGRYGEAQPLYAALAQQFPQDQNAADAAFDAGLMAELDSRPGDAAVAWNTLAGSANAEAAARAELWLGKLALQQGDQAGAATALARAQALQPSGYFGLRAEVLATGRQVGLSGGPAAAPADDWGAVESWLRGWAGPEDPRQFAALQATQDWTEALELDAMGWKLTPNQLFGGALDAAAQQPWALYRAARSLAARGRTRLALQAAGTLLRVAGVEPGGPLTAPPALLRIAYPLDYADLVNQDAAQNGLDPLLVDAVARQESAFDPVAGSSAGAQGLLQLVPATAQDVANALGMGSLAPGDLQRPLVNVALGTRYLAQQARTAGGDVSRALAAYNAGAGNTSRWARQAGGDADRFYETIDFEETRRYLRFVLANYAVYNALYRGTPRPTLLPSASGAFVGI